MSVMYSRTSRPASSYGSGRTRTSYATLNTAVVAPIPSASVTTTTAAKPGERPNERRAYRTSRPRPVTRPDAPTASRASNGPAGASVRVRRVTSPLTRPSRASRSQKTTARTGRPRASVAHASRNVSSRSAR